MGYHHQNRGKASQRAEVEVLVGLQVAVVPEHDELVLGQLLCPFDHELADFLEVAISKEEDE